MISKIKNFIKNDWQYFTFGFVLLIITLLIATIHYSTEARPFDINPPFSSTYSVVAWILVLILGVSGIFLFKNANKDSIKLEKKYLMLAGLDYTNYTTHKLRHTAATLMYKHGHVDVLALQKILGHTNLSTTQIYTHTDDQAIENALKSNPLANYSDKK